MDSDTFVFIDMFLSFSILSRDHRLLTSKTAQKLVVFLLCSLQKLLLVSSKAFIAFSTQFTAKFRLLHWYCEETFYMLCVKSCCQIQVSELLLSREHARNLL
jgi:hypothetical protein